MKPLKSVAYLTASTALLTAIGAGSIYAQNASTGTSSAPAAASSSTGDVSGQNASSPANQGTGTTPGAAPATGTGTNQDNGTGTTPGTAPMNGNGINSNSNGTSGTISNPMPAPQTGVSGNGSLGSGSSQVPGTNINSTTVPGTSPGFTPWTGNTNTTTFTPMARIMAYSDEDTMDQSGMNRYGGPIYTGDANGELAATFLSTGGGPYAFSIKEALHKLIGQSASEDEIASLRTQFGAQRVAQWMDVFDYSVAQAAVIQHENNVVMPAGYASIHDYFPAMAIPGDANRLGIVGDLVSAGTNDNKFYEGLLLDKLVSHSVHRRVMNDIDSKYGPAADADYHIITDQLMVDLAHYAGLQGVHTPDIDSHNQNPLVTDQMMSPAPAAMPATAAPNPNQ